MNEPFLYAGPPRIPPPSMQLRARKETSTRDTVNARFFEQWQSDGQQLVRSYSDVSGGSPITGPGVNLGRMMAVLDMNPINTRTTNTDYRQSQPFIANGPQLGMNPYFDRYDPTFDPRNAVRELRSAVYEDKQDERGIIETRRILDRGFTTRWLPEGYSEVHNMNSLQSYEMMLPKRDDISKNYRGVTLPTAGQAATGGAPSSL